MSTPSCGPAGSAAAAEDAITLREQRRSMVSSFMIKYKGLGPGPGCYLESVVKVQGNKSLKTSKEITEDLGRFLCVFSFDLASMS